ncbi:TRAP transporter small permease [Vibrio sp. HA2012]|uniref:TRAP transporter small permease n=1 Tax=Vibrio sp. HA2012 TaxID=1971595 RepID=UPI000C2B8219|nr:TRAP transporter small permease [Vibrio sp. HA2012]PJC86892.1 TRAP transporter small permease [Vibrio sp. HA2012]
MFKGIEKALNKINAPIANIAARFSGILLLIMTAIVLLQVGCRYILNIPLSWTDETSRFMMIYMTYLCLPIVYLRDQNIAMTFITDKFKNMRVYHLFMMVAHISALALFIIWIYYGWAFYQTGSVMADSLPIPMYTIYIIPPVMLAMSCLAAFEKLAAEIHTLIHFADSEKKLAEVAE